MSLRELLDSVPSYPALLSCTSGKLVVHEFDKQTGMLMCSELVNDVENDYYFRIEVTDKNYNYYTLVDWIEATQSKQHSCQCDFYSVVLVKGCQCGGL